MQNEMSDKNIKKLIDYLKQQGWTDEQINKLIYYIVD